MLVLNNIFILNLNTNPTFKLPVVFGA